MICAAPRAFAAALDTRFFAGRFFAGRVMRRERRFAAMVPFPAAASMTRDDGRVTETFSTTPSSITEVVG